MAIDRRRVLGGLAAIGASGLAPRSALSAVTPGKPFAGQEVKVLAVQSTQFEAQARRTKAFEDATGIKVTFVLVPFSAMRERLTAEMVGGSDDFDLATVMDVWIPPMIDKYLAPIGPDVAARGIDLARYPGPFLAAGQFPSGLYGLPIRCHIQLLWYRKDLFEKAGLKPPTTWDEVASAGRIIQDANPGISGITIPYGKADGQNLMVWYDFLWGAGGDILDANGKPAFNGPAGVKATRDFTSFILKDKITPPGAASFAESDSSTYFFQGHAAMVPVWWHVYTRVRLPDAGVKPDQVGFVKLPSYAGQPSVTYTNDWIYGLNTRSKHRAAALEFLDYITQPEIERSILLDPTISDVVAVQWTNMRDPAVNARFNGLQLVAADAVQNTNKSIPRIAEFLPIVDVLSSAMSDIVTSGADVQTALDGAASRVTRLMRRAG